MLVNTRDLGGLKTKDGRKIKNGLLLRGAYLKDATEDDIKKLQKIPVTQVLDLRTPRECMEEPDPEIPGAININIPVLKTFTLGITREHGSDGSIESLINLSMNKVPNFGKKYMMSFYENLVINKEVTDSYAEFIRYIAANKTGASLWHCTVGKDRAGFASTFIEAVLGVTEDEMIQDYMATEPEIDQMIEYYMDYYSYVAARKDIEDTIMDCFGVRREYILSAFEAINDNFGSMDNFIRDVVGVDDAMKEELRERFLTW